MKKDNITKTLSGSRSVFMTGRNAARRVAVISVYTVLLFSAYMVYAARVGSHLLRVGAVFISAYVFGVLLITLLVRNSAAAEEVTKDKNALSRLLFNGIAGICSPALMCHGDGRVFWYNESLGNLFDSRGARKLYGKNIKDLLGATAEEIGAAPPDDGYGITRFGDRYFIAVSSGIPFERGAALVMLTESTERKIMGDELELIHERLDGCEPAAAYILIDNLAEMTQYDNDSYRPAAARVSEILREWAAASCGIIKEYDRNRFLLITERRFIEESVEKKFDILDKIRETRVGTAQLPVTVSMGVSTVRGTFSDKEKSARAALELALGRGGDQVVLKSDEDTQFYGGRTKASRSRSAVRSRVVAGELVGRISEASCVIIMGHKYADCDSFGASVGLARIAMFCGVDVKVIVDKSDDCVSQCLKLLSDAPGYRGVFVSADEAIDRMSSDTFVIVADVNNLAIAEDPELVDAAKRYAVIDHHRKHAEFGREPALEYIEPTASSTCELVTELAEIILPQDMLTAAEANLLLAGITLDTKQFTRNTGTRTYAAALHLHDCGALPGSVQELFKTELSEYKMEAKYRSGAVVYRNCLAITVCGGSGNSSADKISASKAAESLIGVRGVKAAFAIVTLGNAMHISARSSGEINVQVILEKMGGGGHFDTAGAQVAGVTSDEAVRRLKDAIDEYMAENKIN